MKNVSGKEKVWVAQMVERQTEEVEQEEEQEEEDEKEKKER